MTDQTSSVKLYDGFVAAFAQAEMVGSTSVMSDPVDAHRAFPDASETRMKLAVAPVESLSHANVPVQLIWRFEVILHEPTRSNS